MNHPITVIVLWQTHALFQHDESDEKSGPVVELVPTVQDVQETSKSQMSDSYTTLRSLLIVSNKENLMLYKNITLTHSSRMNTDNENEDCLFRNKKPSDIRVFIREVKVAKVPSHPPEHCHGHGWWCQCSPRSVCTPGCRRCTWMWEWTAGPCSHPGEPQITGTKVNTCQTHKVLVFNKSHVVYVNCYCRIYV